MTDIIQQKIVWTQEERGISKRTHYQLLTFSLLCLGKKRKKKKKMSCKIFKKIDSTEVIHLIKVV